MTMHHLYRWLNAIVLFLLPLDSSIVLAQTINIEAARKEGKVIAYGTIIPQVMEPLHRNLEKSSWIIPPPRNTKSSAPSSARSFSQSREWLPENTPDCGGFDSCPVSSL
jgi:hypothetical protein